MKIIKYIPRSLIIILMSTLVALTCIRYIADVHFNHAMKMKLAHNMDAHIVSVKKAIALNPYVLNYTNVLGLTYIQMAIKSLNDGNDRQEITQWFVDTIRTAETVQRRYPGEYYSAAMLREAYNVLDKLSAEDMSEYIIRYDNIAKAARPWREK